MPSKGRIAVVKAIIPIPPSQCISMRHKFTDRGIISRSVIIVAPVVVKPLTPSKTASVKFKTQPPIYRGRAPKTLIATQAKLTKTNTSRVPILTLSLFPA